MTQKKTLIILSGGFDPVHRGHIEMFREAWECGAEVAVLLNSDAWLIRKKGKFFMDYNNRYSVLKAIKYINSVFPVNDEDNSVTKGIEKIWQIYKDEYNICFGNGGDRTPTNTPEIDFCKNHNIELVFNLGGSKVESSSAFLKNWRD